VRIGVVSREEVPLLAIYHASREANIHLIKY
jgi:hypothetical protein